MKISEAVECRNAKVNLKSYLDLLKGNLMSIVCTNDKEDIDSNYGYHNHGKRYSEGLCLF